MQTREILECLESSYKKSQQLYDKAVVENNNKNKRKFTEGLDEIVFLYSDLVGISCDEAKNELNKNRKR